MAGINRNLPGSVAVVAMCSLLVAADAASIRPKLLVPMGHSGPVTSSRFSPLGNYVITGGQDNRVVVWRARDGRELLQLEGMSEPVWSVAVSGDEELAAASGEFGSAIEWNFTTGSVTWRGHCRSTAFSFGRSLLCGRENGAIVSIDDQGVERPLRPPTSVFSIITTLAAPKSSDFAVALDVGEHRSLIERIAPDGAVTWARSDVCTERAAKIDLSLDGSTVVAVCERSTIVVLDAMTGATRNAWKDLAMDIPAVSVSSDGESIAFSDRGVTFKTGSCLECRSVLIDARSGTRIDEWPSPAVALAIGMSPFGSRLVIAYDNHSASIIDPKNDKQFVLGLDTEMRGSIETVAASPDGRYIASGDQRHHIMDLAGSNVTLWDVNAGRPVVRFLGSDQSDINSVVFSSDSRFMLFGGNDHHAHLYDLSTHELVQFPAPQSRDPREQLGAGPGGHITAVAISADAKLVALGGQSGAVGIYDRVTRRLTFEFDVSGEGVVWGLRFFSNDNAIACSGSKGELIVAHLTGRRGIDEYEGHSQAVNSVAISKDDRYLLSASGDGNVVLWSTAKHSPIWSFSSVRSVKRSAIFVDDDRLVVVGDDYGRLYILNARDGQLLDEVAAHDQTLTSLSLLPKNTVVSGSSDGTLRLWRLSTFNAGKLPPLDLVATLTSTAEIRNPEEPEKQSWGGSDVPVVAQVGPDSTNNWFSKNSAWLVVAPDGRFDFDSVQTESVGLGWVYPDDVRSFLPLKVFRTHYYQERLLPRLLAGERRPVQSLETINRARPRIESLRVTPQDGSADLVSVEVTVVPTSRLIPTGAGNRPTSSGVFDLRLLRDGHPVRFSPSRPGEVRERTTIFRNVRLPIGQSSVNFSAYAFNSDGLQGDEMSIDYMPLKAVSRQLGRAFVLTIGIGSNSNDAWKLWFAAADAKDLKETLARELEKTEAFRMVHAESIISISAEDYTHASKAAILAKLREIAVDAMPEDLVIIAFSSHGYTDGDGMFYLFPANMPPGDTHLSPQVRDAAISSEELTDIFRDIDSDQILLIVDACQAAAVVKDWSQGIDERTGLGQLAFDKGMQVLAATQDVDPAIEVDALGHSILAFSLLEGIHKLRMVNAAPFLTEGEWVNFAVSAVPERYSQLKLGRPQQPVVFNLSSSGIRTAIISGSVRGNRNAAPVQSLPRAN